VSEISKRSGSKLSIAVFLHSYGTPSSTYKLKRC
jgi:hypothetical protein